MWIVNFLTFLAVTLEHIQILIARKYILIACLEINGKRVVLHSFIICLLSLVYTVLPLISARGLFNSDGYRRLFQNRNFYSFLSFLVHQGGKRKCEVGLVVPVKFYATTKKKRTAVTLNEQMKKRKE